MKKATFPEIALTHLLATTSPEIDDPYQQGCLLRDASKFSESGFPIMYHLDYEENDHIFPTDLPKSKFDRLTGEITSSPTKLGAVSVLTEAMHRYSSFQDSIGKLRQKVLDDKRKPLGNGKNAVVFKIVHEGQGLVAKFMKPFADKYDEDDFISDIFDVPSWYGGKESYRRFKTVQTASVLALANSVDDVEKLVSYEPEDGVVISKLERGKPLHKIRSADTYNISREQIEKYVDAFTNLADKGLSIDPNPGNIIWDNTCGLKIIDPIIRQPDEKIIKANFYLLGAALTCTPASFAEDNGPTPSPTKIKAAEQQGHLRSLSEIAKQRFGLTISPYPIDYCEGLSRFWRDAGLFV